MREPSISYKYKNCTTCGGLGYISWLENGFTDMGECPTCDGDGELFVMDEIIDGDKDYEEEYVEDD